MVNFEVIISQPLDGGDKWNVKRPAMMANASLETCNSMAQQRLCVCVWTQPSAISDCLQGSRQNTPASQLIGKRKNAASCVIFCARLFVCAIRKRKRKVDGRPEFNPTIHLLPLAYRYHQLFCWLIDVHLYLTRVIDQVAVERKAALHVHADSPHRPLLPLPLPAQVDRLWSVDWLTKPSKPWASLTNKRKQSNLNSFHHSNCDTWIFTISDRQRHLSTATRTKSQLRIRRIMLATSTRQCHLAVKDGTGGSNGRSRDPSNEAKRSMSTHSFIRRTHTASARKA